jgi:cell division protein FtsQ
MKPFSSSAHVKKSAQSGASLQKNKENANRYRPDAPGGKSRAGRFSGVFALLRYTAGMLGGALVFAGMGIALTHGYNFFITSSYFALERVEFAGNKRLNPTDVLNALEIYKGRNTLAVSLEKMKEVLRNNRWIEEFSIRRVLPDSLEISVKERSPEYLVNRGGVLYYADLCGMAITPALAGDFSSLPALEIESGAEEFALRLPELVRSFKDAGVPLESASLDWLRLTASGLLELRTNNFLMVVVSLDGWEKNLARLKQVLEDLSRRGELRDTTEIRAQGDNVWVLRNADI